MTHAFVPRVGGILSADIAVPEHERELRFYSRVLTTGNDPLWRDDRMNNRGLPVIGLGLRTADHGSLPLQWMPHVQVADVAAGVDRALAAGGRVAMRDESGANAWAVLVLGSRGPELRYRVRSGRAGPVPRVEPHSTGDERVA